MYVNRVCESDRLVLRCRIRRHISTLRGCSREAAWAVAMHALLRETAKLPPTDEFFVESFVAVGQRIIDELLPREGD